MKKIYCIMLLLNALMVVSCASNSNDNFVIESDDKFESEEVKVAYEQICVYIIGEIQNPGVYMVDEGARINDVVMLAGGMTENAAADYVNLAKKVSDGEKIEIYSIAEVESGIISSEEESYLVNINTADKNKLMTLPGIGESKALDIISYREKNGKFSSVEDIMKVSGIKEAAFGKIKDLITVD